MKNDEESPTAAAELAGMSTEVGVDDDDSAMLRAWQVKRDFDCWVAENQHVMELVLAWARERAAAGKEVSARLLVEELRHHIIVDAKGGDVRVPNDFSPLLSRWLVDQDERLREHITIRRSRFDRLQPNER